MIQYNQLKSKKSIKDADRELTNIIAQYKAQVVVNPIPAFLQLVVMFEIHNCILLIMPKIKSH